MYAIEFKAPIKNGVVHIPKEYKDLQTNIDATFVVMYEQKNKNQVNNIKSEIDELHSLISKSDNKIKLTIDLATNTNEMIDDGLF